MTHGLQSAASIIFATFCNRGVSSNPSLQRIGNNSNGYGSVRDLIGSSFVIFLCESGFRLRASSGSEGADMKLIWKAAGFFAVHALHRELRCRGGKMRATGKKRLHREETGRATDSGAGCANPNGTGNALACSPRVSE